MKLSEYISTIENHPEFGPAYVYHRYVPPLKADYGSDLQLPKELLRISKDQGIEKFYTHQVDAGQMSWLPRPQRVARA
jgi:hypothetical protein